jgi:hypothetical protein
MDAEMLRPTSMRRGDHSQASAMTIAGKKKNGESTLMYGIFKMKCRNVLMSSQTAEGDHSIPATMGGTARGMMRTPSKYDLPRGERERRKMNPSATRRATTVLPPEYKTDTKREFQNSELCRIAA